MSDNATSNDKGTLPNTSAGTSGDSALTCDGSSDEKSALPDNSGHDTPVTSGEIEDATKSSSLNPHSTKSRSPEAFG